MEYLKFKKTVTAFQTLKVSTISVLNEFCCLFGSAEFQLVRSAYRSAQRTPKKSVSTADSQPKKFSALQTKQLPQSRFEFWF